MKYTSEYSRHELCSLYFTSTHYFPWKPIKDVFGWRACAILWLHLLKQTTSFHFILFRCNSMHLFLKVWVFGCFSEFFRIDNLFAIYYLRPGSWNEKKEEIASCSSIFVMEQLMKKILKHNYRDIYFRCFRCVDLENVPSFEGFNMKITKAHYNCFVKFFE